jgi:hypothetical protein
MEEHALNAERISEVHRAGDTDTTCYRLLYPQQKVSVQLSLDQFCMKVGKMPHQVLLSIKISLNQAEFMHESILIVGTTVLFVAHKYFYVLLSNVTCKSIALLWHTFSGKNYTQQSGAACTLCNTGHKGFPLNSVFCWLSYWR